MEFKIGTLYDASVIFEVGISVGDSFFLVIYGRHANGYYCAIPNWQKSCEMAEPNDTFYNYEKLCGAGIRKNTAKALAQAIKAVAAALKA